MLPKPQIPCLQDMLQSVAIVLREAGIEDPGMELQDVEDVEEEDGEVDDEALDEEGKQLEDLVRIPSPLHLQHPFMIYYYKSADCGGSLCGR